MSARSDLADQLAELLPKSWKLVPSFRDIDRIDRPTVRVGIRTLAPHPDAGYGYACTVGGVVSIASPRSDVEQAEDQLEDDLVPTLLEALEALPTVQWTRAEKTKWQDTLLAYDIDFTFTTTKE